MFGKCTEILKTQVPFDTDFEFKRMAAAAGCTPSELLRDIVCMAVHKQTFAEMVAQHRRALFSGMGLSSRESDRDQAQLPNAK